MIYTNSLSGGRLRGMDLVDQVARSGIPTKTTGGNSVSRIRVGDTVAEGEDPFFLGLVCCGIAVPKEEVIIG